MEYKSADVEVFDQPHSMMISMIDVEKLVKKLYQPGSPQEIAETEKALQHLQRSPEGWQIADGLMQSQDANVRFFGALTFTIKVNLDWNTLSETDAAALLDRLVGWLIQLVQAEESALVIKKLCSALIAFYLKPSEALNQCVRYLMVSFQKKSSMPIDRLDLQESSISSIIALLSERQAKATLWFAGGLVEELNKINGASIQTYKYFERMSANIHDVVDLLQHSMKITPTRNLSLAENGAKCFQSWIMYAQRGWVDKGLELQALRSLTPLALIGLQHEQTYQAVAELFTDTLNHFPAFLTKDDFRTLSSFLSSADARNIVSRLKGGDFDVDTMVFANLLLAYGDAAVSDLAEYSEDTQLDQILFQLLELLNCDGFGGVEDEVHSRALEFWTTYTEFVVDSIFDHGADEPSWTSVARQRIEAAVKACWVKIQMPPHEIAITWDSETRSSFKSFRKDVHDLLQSSYGLLGVDMFKKLALLALQSLNDQFWFSLEASLFCLNALADLVADDGSVDDNLSDIFGSALFAEMVNTTKLVPGKTRQTAISMISSYTAFFERHTEYLPGMLNFLFESLRSPALVNVVAKALLLTCSSCRERLTSELGAFLQQFELILTWNTIESSTKEKLIGAIAAIIEALPHDEDKIAPLAQLILSVERDVGKCIRAQRGSNDGEFQEKGISALKCLLSMGKALQAADEAVINLELEAFQSLFWTEGHGAPLQAKIIQILDILTGLMKQNSEVIEIGCQILRVGYKEKSLGLFVFPLKTTVDFVLASDLDTARLDCVLDTAGICLIRQDGNSESAMVDAASSFLNHLIKLINAIDRDPSSDPEISTSAIDLAERMIPRYLISMMYTQNMQMVFDFTLRALSVPDIMPKRSAAHFWAVFATRYDLSEDVVRFHRAAMGRYGPLVCQALVNKIAGQASRSELDEVAEPLKKIVFCQPSAKVWLSHALNGISSTDQRVGQSDKTRWLQKILSLRGAKGTNQAVKDFWILCRGSEFSYIK